MKFSFFSKKKLESLKRAFNAPKCPITKKAINLDDCDGCDYYGGIDEDFESYEILCEYPAPCVSCEKE